MSEEVIRNSATDALPSGRAFVVQFTAHTQISQQQVAGRIEHIASGEALHFENLQQLLAFVDENLKS